MSGKPETLLRPPVELYSALISGAGALMIYSAPGYFLMPPTVAGGAAAVLTAMCCWRAMQAWNVIRYQRNIRRLPEYRIASSKIPQSKKKQWLGRGFYWDQRHTQRLHDTRDPANRRYVDMGPLYRWARRMETRCESHALLRPLARLLSSRAWWNPLAPLPPVGGTPQLHAVEPDEHDIWIDLTDKVGHTLVIGTTGVGKTRLEEIQVAQDIRRGDVVVVIDPKGDADLLRRCYSEAVRSGRADRFYMFHIGYPEVSARYNAVGRYSRITEVATRIANQLPNQGNSAAFREFGWRFVNIIARALDALGETPSYQEIHRNILDVEPLLRRYVTVMLDEKGPEDWRKTYESMLAQVTDRNVPHNLRGRSRETVAMIRLLKATGIYDPVADGLRSACEYEKTYFDKIVASLLPFLEKLCTGAVGKLLSPDYRDGEDKRPILDWMNVVRERAVVYVGLDALSDAEVAQAVGNSMFADLVSLAGHIYKHGIDGAPPPNICVHADEFAELIGPEFIQLLNKARGAGFQVTAYTQTLSDIEARLGDHAQAGQVVGNFNTLLMMRVREPRTAQLLTDQLPKVEVFTLTTVSGVTDSSDPESGTDFTSKNEDRISVYQVPMLEPHDLTSLPRGQAFGLIQGGRLVKLRMPLICDRKNPHMPESIAQVADDMARMYASGGEWWRVPSLAPAETGK